MAHEHRLRNLLERIASEHEYKNHNLIISPISSGGANYTSILYTAKVEEDGKNDLNLFIKVGMLGDESRDTLDVKMYDMEHYVYTKMNKIFKELEERHKVNGEDRLVLTKYYGAHMVFKEEMLVLEDLTVKGFSTFDRLKSVDWVYAAAAVRELAKFHALTMAFHKEYPEEHEKFCRDFYTEFITDDMYNEFFKKGFNTTLEVVRAENREKLKKFFDNLDIVKVREMFYPCKKAVLIHTDYRPSNLMHRYREDGSAEVIPIDYQCLRPGCVILDLLYFICTATDEEFRRLHYERLIEHNYTELSAAMTRLGVESSYYSREDYDFELKERLPYGLIATVFPLPIVMIESNDAPKTDDGIDMAIFTNLKISNSYIDRMNGIVNDYVRWGVLK